MQIRPSYGEGGGLGTEGISRGMEIVLLLHMPHDVSKLQSLMNVQLQDMWIDSLPFRLAVLGITTWFG